MHSEIQTFHIFCSLFCFSKTVLLCTYSMKVVLHKNKLEIQSHTWKYIKNCTVSFSHRGCSLSHLKYPHLLLGVCPDGWRAWAGGTKQIIGWSSAGWKGFRVEGSEASRPAEHNEVTLPGMQRVHRVQQQRSVIPSSWSTEWCHMPYICCAFVSFILKWNIWHLNHLSTTHKWIFSILTLTTITIYSVLFYSKVL